MKEPTQSNRVNVNANSDDSISRRAAIDALRAMQTYKLFAGDDMLLIDQAEAQTELMMLPSAQPEQKIGKFVRWMEKRETPDHISYTPHCKCSLCENELLIESINYCYMCGASLIEDREAERKEE